MRRVIGSACDVRDMFRSVSLSTK